MYDRRSRGTKKRFVLRRAWAFMLIIAMLATSNLSMVTALAVGDGSQMEGVIGEEPQSKGAAPGAEDAATQIVEGETGEGTLQGAGEGTQEVDNTGGNSSDTSNGPVAGTGQTQPETNGDDAGKKGQEEARTPEDWTNSVEELQLSVYQFLYKETDQEQAQVLVIDNAVDLSAVNVDALEELTAEFEFSAVKAKTESQIQPGDTFTYRIPADAFLAQDTTGPAPVMNREAADHNRETADQIANYEVKSNVVKVTFTEGVLAQHLSAVIGRIPVTLTLNADALAAEAHVQARISLQYNEVYGADTACVVTLPEKPGEPQDSESTGQDGKIPDNNETDDSQSVSEQNNYTEESKENTGGDAEETGVLDSLKTSAQKLVRRIFAFFTAEQNYAGGVSGSYKYTEGLPDGFTQVKVTIYNKAGGYQTGDNLSVQLRFGIWMDDEFLFHNFEQIMDRGDFPHQGSMSEEEHEEKLFAYLRELSERGEIPPLSYSYSLGDDFTGYSLEEPQQLIDSAGDPCGSYEIKDGVVIFTFDPSSYYYGNISAAVSMEAQLNEEAVSTDPIEIVFDDRGEVVHQSAGQIGGGEGEVGDKDYSVTKEAPARVSNSEITYTIRAESVNDKLLNGTRLVDVLPEGLELKTISYGENKLEENQYQYDENSRTLTYTFDKLKADKSNKITEADIVIVARLNAAAYQALVEAGSIDQTFNNTVKLMKEGAEDPLTVSEEVSTRMKFGFISKEGSQDNLEGTRFSWTIGLNTQLPYLDYGYLVDMLSWTDHRYDLKKGVTVDKADGTTVTYDNIPLVEGSAGAWTELTAERLHQFVIAHNIEGPFCYLYETTTKNPFHVQNSEEPEHKQMAVLVLPFDEFAGKQDPAEVKIKYFTDMNLHGMDMDAYLEFVQEDKENRNPDIGNAVNLLWKNVEGGEGPENRLPESIEWNKEVDTNVEALTKKGTSYNEATQMLTWKMDVNRYGAQLTDIMIEDNLGAGAYDIDADSDLTIQCYKYNLSTKAQVGNETLTKAPDPEVMEKGTYALVAQADGSTLLRIRLDDAVEMEDGKAQVYYYVLDFALKLTDAGMLANQSKDQTKENSANITALLDGKDFQDTTEAKITVPNTLIDKTAVGTYDYNTHKLSWSVTINPNKLTIKDAQVKDILPEGITWDKLTGILINGAAVADELTNHVTVNVADDKQTAEFKLVDEEITETYTFLFDTDVTEAWRDKNLIGTDGVSVENKAELQGTLVTTRGESAIDPQHVFDTAQHVVTPINASKGGVYDADTGTITWQVLFNADQLNIAGTHLVEDLESELSEGSVNIQELDIDSIEVYTVTVDSKGTVSEKAPLENPTLTDRNGVKGSEPDEKGFTFVIPSEGAAPNTNTYLVTFKTDLTDAATEYPDARITNKVYLKNENGDQLEESGESDGGYTGGFDADDVVTKDKRPKVKLTKTSDNSIGIEGTDKTLLLSEAEFSLIAYKFQKDGNTINLLAEMERYDKIRLTYDGTAVFLNIKAQMGEEDLFYVLEERKAPAGYVASQDKNYIIFAKNPDEYRGVTTLEGEGHDAELVSANDDPLKINYFVKSSTGGAEDTLAAVPIQNSPVETDFTFTKEIADSVAYSEDGTNYTYTYKKPGADEVVFKIEPAGHLIGHVKTHYISSREDGTFLVKGLDAGSYTMTEVKSPKHITNGASYTLEVKWDTEGNKYIYEITGTDNKGTLLVKDEATGAYTIRDEYVTGPVSFDKYVQYKDQPKGEKENPNNNREILSGVEFTLTSVKIAEKENTSFKQVQTSGENGKVSFANVPVGEYELTETQKDGYTLQSVCTVTVAEEADTNNQIGEIDGEPVYAKKIKVTYGGTDLVKEGRYNNEAIKGEISFTKQAGSSLTALDGTPLAEAEFGLYRKIGTETAEEPTYKAKSDAEGKVAFTGVEYGDYVLKEITTPEGYNAISDITLTRDLYTISENKEKFTYDVTGQDQKAGVVKDQLIQSGFTLYKKDQDGNLLPDRTFQIYRKNPAAIEADGTGMVVAADENHKDYYRYAPKEAVTTGTEGEITVSELPYGEYLLVEEQKADQQESDNTAIYASVEKNNKVVLKVTHGFNGTWDEQNQKFGGVDTTTAAWKSLDNNGTVVDSMKYGLVQIQKRLAEQKTDGTGTTIEETETPIGDVSFKVEKKTGENTYIPYLTLKTKADGTFEADVDGKYTDADDANKKHFLYGTYKFTEAGKDGLAIDTAKSLEITFGEGQGEVKHGYTAYLEYTGTGDYTFAIKEKPEDTPGNPFYNVAARAGLSLKKSGVDGEQLNDAKFAVYIEGTETPVASFIKGEDGIYQLSDASVTDSEEPYKVSRSDGVPYLYQSGDNFLLLEGSYVLKEMEAPKGYERFQSEIPFTIAKDNAGKTGVQYSGDIEGVTWDSDAGQFQVTDIPIEISLTKEDKDESSKKLKGAVFHLYRESEAAPMKFGGSEGIYVPDSAGSPDAATGENGGLVFKKLPTGSYKLVEAKAAPGYATLTESQYAEFTIADDGKISGFTTTAGEYFAAKETDETDGMLVKNKKNMLQFTKLCSDGEGGLNEAQFTLSPVAPTEGTSVTAESVTTEGATGTVTFTGIVPGTYTLSESEAPDGYAPSQQIITVVVSDTGAISMKKAGGETTVTAEELGSIFKNRKVMDIEGTKTWVYADDASDVHQHPESVTVHLFAREKGSEDDWTPAVYADETKVKELTITRDSADAADANQWVYKFEKIPAQDADDKDLEYKVTEDAAAGYHTSMTGYDIENKENSLTIHKSFVDNNGGTADWTTDPTFVLQKADGTTISAVMDKETKKAVFTQIPDGTYILKESASDEGYITNTQTYPVTVKDGIVGITTGTDTTSGVNVEKEYVNYKLGHFAFTKQMETGDGWKPMEGAEFTLTPADANLKAVKVLSEADGKTAFAKLLPGEYTLEETAALPGYSAKENAITVSVADDGKVTFKEGSEERSLKDLDTIYQNPYTKVKILKADDKGQAVTGAVLKLTAEDGKELADGRESAEWTSTADGWDLTGLLTTGVAYTITETQRVIGNKTAPKDITFTLNKYGELETVEGAALAGADAEKDAQQNVYTIEAADNRTIFTVRDVEIQGSITFKKSVDTQAVGTGSRYDGITFSLYRSAVEPEASKSDEENAGNLPEAAPDKDKLIKAEITLNEEGKATVEQLEEGYYYFVETASQNGLYLDTTPSKIVYIGQQQHGTVTEISMENVNFETYVTLTKTDAGDENSLIGAAGDKVAGTEFTLYKTEGTTDTEAAKAVTDKNGTLTFTIRSKGTYKIVETKAAKGYLVGDKPYTAVFTVDNTADFQKKTLDLSSEAEVSSAKDQYKLTLENVSYAGAGIANQRDTGKVTLYKQDEDEKSLDGVTFTLYKKDTEGLFGTLKEFLTGKSYTKVSETSWDEAAKESGKLVIEGLSWGDYRIKETSQLDGYSLNDEGFIFRIDKTTGTEIELAVDRGTVTNLYTRITVQKTNLDGLALAGGEYKLAGAFADGTSTYTWTSEIDAKEIKGLLITGEEYILTEEKAPAGYIRTWQETRVRLEEDGTLVSIDDDLITSEQNAITIENEPVELQLQKFSPQGEKLKGCVFSVTGVFAPLPGAAEKPETQAEDEDEDKDKEETIIVDDENPDALKARLIAGNTYTLQEVTPPSGYVVGGKVRFVVNEDGTITMEESEEYTWNETTGTIEMVNDEITVKLKKTDMEQNPLSGAVFTVTGQFADGTSSKEFRPAGADALEITGQFVEGQQYSMIETTPPSGYKKLAGAVVFQVSAGNVVELVSSDSKVSISKEEVKREGKTDREIYTISVKNEKVPAAVSRTARTGDNASALPWIIGIGAALIAIAGVCIYKKKKK